MANAWLDIKGPVVADTVYDGGVLVAKDTNYTLPGLEFLTATVQAMGNMDVPLMLLENMQLTINKIGIDKGLGRMNRLEKHNFEFRGVQNVVKADGSETVEGYKAFVRTMPSSSPELSSEVGSTLEGETVYNVTRMQIYIGSYEYCCVDRLNQILRIDGKDYMAKIRSLL